MAAECDVEGVEGRTQAMGMLSGTFKLARESQSIEASSSSNDWSRRIAPLHGAHLLQWANFLVDWYFRDFERTQGFHLNRPQSLHTHDIAPETDRNGHWKSAQTSTRWNYWNPQQIVS
jgi:hypothetical protein